MCFSRGEPSGLEGGPMKLDRFGVPIGFRCEAVDLGERTVMDLRDMSKRVNLEEVPKGLVKVG